MAEILEARRSEAKGRFERLREELRETEHRAIDKACVYVTGSFGRGEASKFSDLDLFIVGRGEKDRPALRPLDEICVKADLIEASRRLQFPEFSGDGQYLAHYTEQELIGTLGKPDDDVSNTFTARLLLLLESQPLLGKAIYDEAIGEVVAAYWKDYEDHKIDFIPTFLTNDILRLWRTFCVNYEARTSADPPERKAKRKLKNYKLKHSRLLTCYSAILYLLAVFMSNKTVHPDDAIGMARLSPTARLEWLLTRNDLAQAHQMICQLLYHYEEFLAATSYSEEELVQQILTSEKGKELFPSANEFGNLMFITLQGIGQGSELHRFLVV